MPNKAKRGVEVLLDVKRFVPSLRDLKNPLPDPKKGELVMQGITADVLGYGLGYIPGIGDVVGQFVNDNIMADVLEKMTAAERNEFKDQNRVYPNGIALLRTFQRERIV